MHILSFDMTYFFIILFILINVIKITAFNMYTTNSFIVKFSIYKFIYTLLLSLIIFEVLSKQPILLLVFYAMEYAYLYSNLSYFNFYHYYLHLYQSITLLPEAFDVLRYKALPKNYNLLLIFIDLPILIVITILGIGSSGEIYIPREFMTYSIIISLIGILIIEIYYLIKKQSLFELIKNYPKSEVQIIKRYGTLFNIIIDLFMFKNDKDRIQSFKYGNKIKSDIGDKEPTNIIAIQVESMEANIINTMYNGKFVMPYLQELTKSSIYYPYMVSYHKAGGTSDAEFSVLNSVEPLGNYPSIKMPSYDFPNSVVKILKENNYQTSAFHGNLVSYYHRDKAFAKMGFDNFYDINNMGLKNVGWGAPDHDLFNYVLKMPTLKKPYFHYIITMSSHCMFTNVRNYYNNDFFNDITDKVVRNYFNSLAYVDNAIKDFITGIKKKDENTAVIIWGDHTPGIKRDSFKQSLLKVNGKFLEIVPLFIIPPGKMNYKEEKNVVSSLDIAPTILELANIPYMYKTDGESLLKPSEINNKIPYRGEQFNRSMLFKCLIEK